MDEMKSQSRVMNVKFILTDRTFHKNDGVQPKLNLINMRNVTIHQVDATERNAFFQISK